MSVLSIRFFTSTVVDLGRSYCFRPMVGPVEIVRVPGIGVFSAENYAVDQTAQQSDESEYEKDNTQDPEKKNYWFMMTA